MKNVYVFRGLECMIGRSGNERILHPGDTIELDRAEYQEALDGGAALAPVESPKPKSEEK